LAFFTFEGGSVRSIPLAGGVTPGSWQHIVVTAAGNEGKIYLNGLLVATGSALIGNKLTREFMYIGKSMWNENGYFDGTIALFRSYEHELTLLDVSQLYAAKDVRHIFAPSNLYVDMRSKLFYQGKALQGKE
jgi:hypothetical protein